MSLRYALPITQMLLAVALWWCSNQWQLAVRHIYDAAGPAPSFDLLLIVSWPVALVRTLWARHLPYLWDEATSVAAIGLFWYWWL